MFFRSESDAAGPVMCELLDLAGPTANNMLMVIVRNTLTGELIHFGWERNSRNFVLCNNLGQVEHEATRFVNSRQLIDEVWPSDRGHSVMSLTASLESILEKITGMHCFCCCRVVFDPIVYVFKRDV